MFAWAAPRGSSPSSSLRRFLWHNDLKTRTKQDKPLGIPFHFIFAWLFRHGPGSADANAPHALVRRRRERGCQRTARAHGLAWTGQRGCQCTARAGSAAWGARMPLRRTRSWSGMDRTALMPMHRTCCFGGVGSADAIAPHALMLRHGQGSADANGPHALVRRRRERGCQRTARAHGLWTGQRGCQCTARAS